MAHDAPEIPVGGMQEEMVVIVHQTVPLDYQPKAFMRFGQGIQKGVKVREGVKNRSAFSASIHEMIARPLVFDPDRSPHGPKLPSFIL